jgi:uracil phosphoribosyltransferase
MVVHHSNLIVTVLYFKEINMAEVIVIKHPLVQDKLTLMRDKNTDSGMFRILLSEITELLGYEVTRNLPTYDQEVETPLGIKTICKAVKSKNIALVSVLRAGTGMLDGMLKLIPTAPVGHIGLYRDPKNYSVIEYYFKLPLNLDSKQVIVLDPMLATGHSAVAAVERIKEFNPKSIVFIAVVAAPEGVAYFQEHHPDIELYTAAVDEKLNAKNYIVPGMGDAGDRMFGTA